MVEQCASGAIPLYIVPYCSHIGALYEMLRQFYNGWRQNELSKLYYARLIEKFEKMVSPIWDFSLFIFAPAKMAIFTDCVATVTSPEHGRLVYDAIQHIYIYIYILTEWGHPGWPLSPIMGHFGAKNGHFLPYIDNLLMLSCLCCNYDKPRAWKVGIGSHTTYFGQVESSRLATGPNYGPFQNQ